MIPGAKSCGSSPGGVCPKYSPEKIWKDSVRSQLILALQETKPETNNSRIKFSIFFIISLINIINKI